MHRDLGKMQDRFGNEVMQPGKVQGKVKKPIEVNDLTVGSEVKIGDEKLKVTAVDPDTNEVELSDGKRYGVQKVQAGEVIYAEKVKVAKPPAGEDPFARNAVGRRMDDAERQQWETKARELGDTIRYARGSNQARQYAREFVNKPLHNLDAKVEATVSGGSLDEMLQPEIVNRSISPQAHMQAVANLDHLFEIALEHTVRDDRKGGEKIKAMRHFDAAMPFNGEVLRVKIMAKEFTQTDQGTRLYTVRALKIEKPASSDWEEPSAHKPNSVSHPLAGFDENFARLTELVNPNTRQAVRLRSPEEVVARSLAGLAGMQPTETRLEAALRSAEAVRSNLQAPEWRGRLGALHFALREIKQEITHIPIYTPIKRVINEWIGKQQANVLRTMGHMKEIERLVPRLERREAITNWLQANGDRAALARKAAATQERALRRGYEAAQNLTPEEIAVARKIRGFYDDMLVALQEAGLVKNAWDNYVNQAWNKDQIRNRFGAPAEKCAVLLLPDDPDGAAGSQG